MQILLFSGKAQAGKTATALIVKEKLESMGKNVLKISYGDLVKYVCKQYFGWNGQKDEKGRTMLQYIGTDIIRHRKPDYWVNFVKEFVKLFEDEFDYVVVDDSRFLNEMVSWIKDGWDVVTVRVIRENFISNLTTEQLNHPSETDLDNFDFDYYIISDNGLDKLIVEVDKFMEYLEI